MVSPDGGELEGSRWVKAPSWNYAHRVYPNGTLACRPGDPPRYGSVPEADEFARRCHLCDSVVGKSTL